MLGTQCGQYMLLHMGVFHLKSGIFCEKFQSWDTCKISINKLSISKFYIAGFKLYQQRCSTLIWDIMQCPTININRIVVNYLARIRNQRKVLFLNETLPHIVRELRLVVIVFLECTTTSLIYPAHIQSMHQNFHKNPNFKKFIPFVMNKIMCGCHRTGNNKNM